MSNKRAVGDDLQQISDRIATLRGELDGLRNDVTRLGRHQLDNLQTAMEDTAEALADAVRRNPFGAVGIAAGIGFLYALLRR